MALNMFWKGNFTIPKTILILKSEKYETFLSLSFQLQFGGKVGSPVFGMATCWYVVPRMSPGSRKKKWLLLVKLNSEFSRLLACRFGRTANF